MACMPFSAQAQNGSNSSYSRFGLGTMADQSQTFNRGMGGVAYGLRNGSRVNMLNPASYSAIDSLSFLFDVGMSLQYGHLSIPGSSSNVRNTTLTNVNAGFRVSHNLGMSFGFVPYSTIGYTFEAENKVGNDYTSTQSITTKNNYSGNGGLHQLYIGAGWKPFAELSIGMNASLLWGSYNHQIAQTFFEGTSSTSSTSYSSQHQSYTADLTSYKLDFGIQYPIRLSRQDWVTLGATYSLGHSIGGDASLLRYTSAGDSTEVVAKKPFEMPHTFGGGLSWQHKNTLTVAADFTYEKWADCKAPVSSKRSNGDISYEAQTGSYLNRSKYAVGIEYTPDPLAYKSYMQTVRYRLGFNYSTPYLKVNGLNGPKEYRATVGLGLPLNTRRLSGRSMINVSAEWMQRRPSIPGMIKENYILVNLGISFNEKWFMKWKIN